jgi:hypothetical protein
LAARDARAATGDAGEIPATLLARSDEVIE